MGNLFYFPLLKRSLGLSKHDEEERPLLHRLALHSHQLNFKDVQGDAHALEAPLPKDINALLQQLKKNRS